MTQLPAASQSPQGSTKVVIVALVLAGVALVGVNAYIEYVRSQMRDDELMVYRLNQSVEPGDELNEDMLIDSPVQDRYRDSYDNAVKAGADLQARLGQTFQRYANRNDFLTYDLFVDPEEHELDRRITMGNRLIALPVNPRNVTGGLRPGMFVDIDAPLPGTGGDVEPIIERVKVLMVGEYSIVDEAAAGERRPTSLGNYSNISIEVTPEQATQLAQISRIVTGDFFIHVRNPGDQNYPKIEDGGINPEVLELLDQQTDATAQR
ncbi:MAG: RcpC/CpaB family pilus assembly protein [Phycisphaeraceae bacterium]